MALGGGTFIAQNKVLPGAYINFISAAMASAALSDRGIAAIGIVTSWGKTGEIIEVTSGDFQKDTLKLFGVGYTDSEMKPLREIFANSRVVYCYRLNSNGVKASNDYATAKYPGVKGNDIRIVIRTNVDDTNKFDVITYFGSLEADIQTVATAADLVSNDYVDFKTTATLEATAGAPLENGTNGDVESSAHQAFLDKLEAYTFNALGCASDDNTIKGLYVAYNKRMRDEIGKKFQLVVHDKAADYEGVINVKNTITDTDKTGYEMAYWATGVAAGTPVNASATNKVYDGEYTVNVDYTQAQLEAAINNGEFTFHNVGGEVRVLTDINSLVTVSDTKGANFKSNQTIRVIDQIANDIAVTFNTNYLGNVPNDTEGRTALWMDIVKHHTELMRVRAIEDFNEDDVTVERGDDPKSVVVTDAVTPVNAMEKLYMTVTVS